jgi:hypothetical protein
MIVTRLRPAHGTTEAPKLCSFDRSLGVWDFEDGSYVQIVVSGKIPTAEALDMVLVLVQMKRDELAKLPVPNADTME